jgi:hypothetical protein
VHSGLHGLPLKWMIMHLKYYELWWSLPLPLKITSKILYVFMGVCPHEKNIGKVKVSIKYSPEWCCIRITGHPTGHLFILFCQLKHKLYSLW